ncbi:PrgI family mobile element protein [Bacillus infantis]|uniref:PrgI family mobile element protein n=1 Tax=Bacillus infantis TaxID=324767 RepID=UPI00209DCEF6|nr:PrgI family protein [Bacillus infantis]MCP1161371.1 PrgI family protein [Bacillus infantis]
MNEIIVPVDLTEEEKEILAVFSKRQFLIVFPSLFVSLALLVFVSIPFLDGWVDGIIRFIFAILILGGSVALAYIKLDKHEQYLSEFFVTKFKFLKSQKVYHS